ncbi:hypothetical protein GT201_004282 [Salmonella enterica]|nr:hypothetical protein [Salmonella enterica]
MFHTIVSIKNDGHYFCRAGGNRPDGLNEPVTVIELNVPVFSEDGKVEMAGSGSEHEFPRCDGHGGADFADTKDVKKPTGEAGFFTVTLQS